VKCLVTVSPAVVKASKSPKITLNRGEDGAVGSQVQSSQNRIVLGSSFSSSTWF